MAALAEMDLDTLTPEQAAAARQALAALETLRAENEAQSERIRRLEHLNLELIRLLYGKRSEKLSADERQLAFEELEGASAEVEAAAGDCPVSCVSECCGSNTLWRRTLR